MQMQTTSSTTANIIRALPGECGRRTGDLRPSTRRRAFCQGTRHRGAAQSDVTPCTWKALGDATKSFSTRWSYDPTRDHTLMLAAFDTPTRFVAFWQRQQGNISW
ncbi:MAG: hypothetical protein HPM95_00710 [Alphaproteobacteria bacterium]|nr:hypothetical protein [Alphaproteobacteria bacterium]